MKNKGFKFKQFEIQQDQCAMKVCTDACLFGALIEVSDTHHTILDIGTGTGLLSLMLAQRTNAQISAVEIDEDAFSQAKQNFEQSNFSSQLNVFHTSIQAFESSLQYDLIVSNPPFYQKSLQSTDNQHNKALHGITLTLPALCDEAARLLNKNGDFWVLLPVYEAQLMVQIAKEKGLYLQKRISVRHDISKNFIREILHLKKSVNIQAQAEILEIYDINTKKYSERFKALLKEYYIIF